MDLDSLLRFISTPLLAKLFVEALAFSVLLFNRKRDLENVSTVFLGTLVLFFLRDVIFQFFPFPEIVFVSDLLAFVSIFFVFSWFMKKRANAIAMAAVNLVILILFSANLVLSIVPDFMPGWFEIFLAIDLAWFVIASLVTGKKDDSIPQQVVSRTWMPFAVVLLAYLVLTLLLGYGSEAVQRLVFPLFYCAYFMFAATHLTAIERQGQEERDYLTNTIDSIYSFMESSGSAFKNAADMNELLDHITKSVMEETKASGGLIAMIDEFDDILAVKCISGVFPPPFKLPAELPRKQARVEAFMKHAQFKLGETVFGEAAKAGQSIFIDDPKHDARVAVNGDEPFLAYSSLIVVPFTVGDKVIGVLGVTRSNEQGAFSEFEYERCRMLADFGTIVIRNLMSAMEASEKSNIEKEVAISQDIQKTMMPKKVIDVGNISMGAFSAPARGVYSDYYDIIHNRENRVILVMADVAGKGVQASLIMVMIRALLHLTTNTTRDIATIMNWVNRGITGKIEMDHFATLALLSVDMETGEIEYANANQQPLLIIRKKKNEVEFVEMESVPIGVERRTEYAATKIKLQPGDLLAVYTDGIPEAMNIQGKQYGKKRLSDIIMRNMGQPVKDLAITVRKDLQEFIGQARQHDDQSLLVLKMKAQTER